MYWERRFGYSLNHFQESELKNPLHTTNFELHTTNFEDCTAPFTFRKTVDFQLH